MANDNQNQVLDEQTDVVEEKPTKRVRKSKPKTTEGGSTASLFGIEPYQPKKNEEYMSEGQLEHFRQILMAWKAELMSEVDRTLNTMQDENTALPDVNDRATQEEEFAIELRTRDRERKL
ncbi:MAG TPA: RNA polymerase-binding protein DksA, partial [Acinetobacter sp.]|nr:RNA polymerase-binding protein DksA [Acinetobacter sp.]